jgi:hypothetical protein
VLPSLPLRSLRWIARILSLLCIGVILAFALGEGLRLSAFAGREMALFLFFPVGVCLGMILGWWREGLGGGVTIGSLLAFYAVHFLVSQRLPKGFAFAAFALPGGVFFLYWLCSRAPRTRPAAE